MDSKFSCTKTRARRAIAVILTVAILFSLLPAGFQLNTVEAATLAPDYTWYGDGSSSDFTISSSQQLQAFANLVNGADGKAAATFAGKSVTLSANIDLTGVEWIPIGNNSEGGSNFPGSGPRFNGTFDGGNYSIIGLNVNLSAPAAGRTIYGGFFGVADSAALIKNLNIQAPTISAIGGNGGGALSGAIAGTSKGTILNCNAVGGSVKVICNPDGSSDIGTGGIVGFNKGGIVSKCSSSADVSIDPVAWAQSELPPSFVGGVAGGNEGTVNNCYSTGDLFNQLAVGTSWAKSLTAGIVGLNNGTANSIVNCFFSGTVAGNTTYTSEKLQIAGIMGYSEVGGSTSGCYYDNTKVASSTNTHGTGLSTSQMQDQNSFSGWDFVNVWEMDTNYPVLKGAVQCKCTVSTFDITSSDSVVIPYGQNAATYQLTYTTPTVDCSDCTIAGHDGVRNVSYGYFIEPKNGSPADGASIDETTQLMTFSKEGTYEVTVTAIDPISQKANSKSIIISVTNENCTCEIPDFTVQNQTVQIPYGQAGGQFTFTDPNITLKGECTVPGHSDKQITFVYEIISKDADITNAAISGKTLSASGQGKVTVNVTGTAPDTDAVPVSKTLEVTFTKENCTCSISDFSFEDGKLTIPYGESNVEKTFTDPADAVFSPCTLAGHSDGIVQYTYEIVADSNTANASIIGKTLTAANEGSFSVKITAYVSGTAALKEKIAKYTVTKEKLIVPDCFKSIRIISGQDAALGWDTNISGQIKINVKDNNANNVYTASVNAANGTCKIPATVLNGIKGYTAEIIVSESKPSVNVNIDIVPPQTKLLFDAAPNVYYDTVSNIVLTWKTYNELPGSTKKVTVKRGNTEYTSFTASANSVNITGISKPSTNIDTYTVTVTSNFGGTDLTSGSFVFSIYKTNDLEITNTLDNAVISGSKPLTISNESIVASLNSSQLLSKVNSLNLQHTVKLKQSFSTYGEDSYQWTVADTKIATIAGNDGIKDTYSSSETMILTGLKDGETTVTVKHVPTGNTASFKVIVKTLNGKLFVLQAPVKAVVKLDYTADGQNKSVTTNSNGMAAIYEPTGITGNIAASGTTIGDIYVGTTNSSTLASGETPRAGGTYPISKVNAAAATKITLQLSAASGSLDTKTPLAIKGFLLRNGVVVDSQAKDCTPASYAYQNVTLNFDTTKLGSISSSDKIKFVYEIAGGSYAPAYTSVDAASSGNTNFDIIKVKLQSAKANQTVYVNSMFLSTPSSGLNEDVTTRTQYVTLNKNDKTRTLKALVCWPKGQVGVPKLVNEKGDNIGASNITYTNLSLPDMNFGWQEVVVTLDSKLITEGCSLKFSFSFYNTIAKTTTQIPVPFLVSNITNVAIAEKITSVPFTGDIATGKTGLNIIGNKSFNFVLPNGLKAAMDYDFTNDPLNGTFRMLIGYNKDMPDEDDPDFAGAISDVKDLIKEGKDALGGGKGSAGFKVAGFLMGNACYRNGEWVIIPTGGGMLGAVEVGYKYSQTNMVGIIPVNYGVELTAGVEATLIIDSTTVTGGVTKKNFDQLFDFYLKVYGSVYAYGGVGFDLKIIAARIGIFGTLGLEYYFRTAVVDSIRRAGGQLKLSGSIGIEAVVKFLFWKKRYVFCEAGFTKNYKPNGFDFTDYGGFERPDLPGMKRMMSFVGNDGIDYEVYESEFELEDRDYLSQPQVWKGGASDSSKNLFGVQSLTDTSVPSTNNIAENVYPYANPILSSDGNLMVMLDDSASEDVNKTGPAFSTKNGDGTWSEPARIFSTETPASGLVFNGSSSFAVAAWEGVENPVAYDDSEEPSNVKVSATLGTSEIFASSFNGTGWVTKQITKNSEADLIPEVSSNGNKAIVAWQRAAISADDPGKISGKNEILYSIFDGTAWSNEKILDTGDAGNVKSFSVAMASDGKAVVTLSIDTDGDNLTYPDMEIFNYFVYEDGTTSSRIALTSNASADSNPQVIARKLNINGTEKEYFLTAWYNEILGEDDQATQRKVQLDVREMNGNKADGFTSSFGTAGGNFSFIKSTDSSVNTAGIVWSEAVNQGTAARQTIYAKLLTDGIDGITSTTTFEIVDGDPNYEEICEVEAVAKRNSDSVSIGSVYLKKNIGIDMQSSQVLKTTSTDIMSTDITVTDAAEIVNVSANASETQLQSTLPIKISVKNNGFTKITGFKVCANNQSFTLDSVLLPDQVTDLNLNYTVSTFDDVNITVTPLYNNGSVEGSPLSDTIVLLAPDVNIQSIIQTETGDNGNRVFDIGLSNTGTKALADSGYKVKVSVFEDFERTIKSEITDLATGCKQNSDLEISDNDALKAIDEGKGLVRIGYTINGDSYNSFGNKTLYISVTIVDANGLPIEDANTINNEGGITFVTPKLLYPSQFEVTVVQNNSEGVTNADLTVRNLYPESGTDTLRLRLFEGDTLIEQKTIDISMQPESTMTQSLKFTKSGTKVVAAFGSDLIKPDPEAPTQGNGTTSQGNGTTTTQTSSPASSGTEAVVKETGEDGTVKVKAAELTKATSLTIKSDVRIIFDTISLKSLEKVGDFIVGVKKAEVSGIDSEIAKNIGSRPAFNLSVSGNGKDITSFDGGYVDVSIPYTLKDGESPDAILVYYIDANGKAIPVYSEYDMATKTVRFTTSHFSTYAVAYNKVIFSDVSGWAESHITYLAARNVISGVGGGEFAPQKQLTRAQFTSMLFGISGMDKSSLEDYRIAGFKDISLKDWYTPHVMWAYKNGIVGGIGNDKFDPNANITREQMAVMFYNFIKFSGVKLTSDTKNEDFKDTEKISSWAADAVKFIQGASIISGKGEGVFDPAGAATRAEASAVVATYIHSLLK